MRQALTSVKQEVQKKIGTSAIFEQPKITFAVGLNEHNVQIVPSREDNGHANVMSGTCVNDERIMHYFVRLQPEVDSADDVRVDEPCSDFLLTAQRGLKGTSKPVFYRVILNENLYCRPHASSARNATSALTRDVLQSLAFPLTMAQLQRQQGGCLYFTTARGRQNRSFAYLPCKCEAQSPKTAILSILLIFPFTFVPLDTYVERTSSLRQQDMPVLVIKEDEETYVESVFRKVRWYRSSSLVLVILF